MSTLEIIKQHDSDYMDEAQNNAMRAFISVVESRAIRSGNKIEATPVVKNTLSAKERKSILLKNYYRKVQTVYCSSLRAWSTKK